MAVVQRIICILSFCLLATTVCLVAPGAAFSKDPYKTLGVNKDADDNAIKRAYKKLALKYHPDKNPKGQSKFIEIQQAYEILSDADKKREYDLGGGPSSGHFRYEGASRHQHQQHQYYQYYQQQQQAYQQQQEQMHERALPSNTTFLTTSNFRTLVFYGGRPWLMMVYTEDLVACREFSSTWEALWRSLGGSQPGQGSQDGASVGLGRIHARFQRTLVQYVMKAGGLFSGGTAMDGELPVLVAVPNGCTEASCFVRYRGPLRLTAIQDFLADRLLQLPRVPQLEPPGVAAFLRRASPYKVVVVAFGRGGGSGSLALRTLAERQKDMLTVVRGHVQDDISAVAWTETLGLSTPPSSGTVVFLRGPGTTPRVLAVPPGKTADLQQQIDEQGLLWQEVPPLRPATGASLGCLWGRAAASSGRSMIDTCVVVVAPRGPQLEEARRRMAVLGRYLAAQGAQRDASISSAAAGYMAGRLRLAWMDASAQQHLCSWMLGTPAAMRPTNTAPPPGTNAAGKAAAAAQALAAAAAKSPELVRAVCGPAPLDLLGRARDMAAAAANAVRLPILADRLRPRPTARLIVLRPSVDGSSWFRGGTYHMRHGRPVFSFAVNADFDLSATERSADVDLPRVAVWINQMHLDPDRHMHASTTFPPPLRADDDPGALEYVIGRVYTGAKQAARVILGFVGADVEGSSALMQALNLVVPVLVLLVVQVAWWRRIEEPAGRRRNDPSARRGAAAQAPRPRPTSEAPLSPEAPPADAPASEPGVQGRRSLGSDRGLHGDSDSGDDRGTGTPGRSQERTASLNRRALSPSWRIGRRGDARRSDGGTEGAKAVEDAGAEGRRRTDVGGASAEGGSGAGASASRSAAAGEAGVRMRRSSSDGGLVESSGRDGNSGRLERSSSDGGGDAGRSAGDSFFRRIHSVRFAGASSEGGAGGDSGGGLRTEEARRRSRGLDTRGSAGAGTAVGRDNAADGLEAREVDEDEGDWVAVGRI